MSQAVRRGEYTSQNAYYTAVPKPSQPQVAPKPKAKPKTKPLAFGRFGVVCLVLAIVLIFSASVTVVSTYNKAKDLKTQAAYLNEETNQINKETKDLLYEVNSQVNYEKIKEVAEENGMTIERSRIKVVLDE